MQPVPKGRKANPAQNANLCSKVFFWWLNPLFILGHKQKLEEDDMYEVLPEDASRKLGEELQWYWDKELQKAQKKGCKPRLTKAIIRCHWKTFSVLGLFTFLEEAVKVVQPIFLGNVISYFERDDLNDSAALANAYINAAALSVCTLILAVVHHIYFYHVLRAGMKLRIAMCHMIYRKALRLSNTAMGKTTTGQIVNLLSNDVNKFDQVTIFLHFLWVAPLQVIAVTVLLWMEIGPSCLAGISVLIILMPLQFGLGKFFTSLRGKTAAFTDTRIRTMNEVISGMRIIKMYAWEQSFSELVNNIRKKEINKVLRSSYLRALNLASFFVASKIILFVTFTTYVLLGNVISASRVFVAVSLYSAVRLTVTLFFPSAVEKASEARVSIRRVKNFLLLDEISKPALELSEENEENLLVQIQDLTCYWDKTLEIPTLRNISCSVRPGELLAVIGPVGAGKSSLLSAVLGELPKDKGFVDIRGKIAYVSQQPWVFSGTVRSNVLFGKEYVQEKYEKVLRACALKKDMLQLNDGDLTMIGDRGVTLSGGQKARVNLARAVYQDADIYLLDDPLSAVDAEVGRHLFEKCICQALRKKLCILVTHQLQYLSAAKQILILKEGQMIGKGTFQELLQSGIDFASLLKSEEEEQSQPQESQLIKSSRNRTFSESSVWSQDSSVQSQKEGATDHLATEPVLTAIPEESRSEGTVGFKVYKKYFTSGSSYLMLFVVFLLTILSQVAYVLQDWWLSYWANEQGKLNVTSDTNSTESKTEQLDLTLYLGVYAGLTAATIIFGVLRCLLVFRVLVYAAQTLHNQMFQSLLNAPILFFDRNPIGRILNRFSKDIGHLDDLLPFTFLDFIQVFLQILGVIAVAVSVIPWILVPLLPLVIVFYFLRRYFLDTSRDIKRLESTTRSPVFSHLSSSLQGLWTIRAFRSEKRFQDLFDAQQDLHSEAWFLFLTTSRWLAVRLDAICAVFVVALAFGSIILAENLEAGQVGLVLSYGITLMGSFQWGVRQSAEVENLMISAERVMEYTQLEKEAEWETKNHPPADWPNKGMITFENVNFSYSLDGPLVLRHLNASIRPKEKVGIVGRTGAGKSSLIAALFRLAEPEGKIWIDKYLTSELGLHDLRKKMSIIPQEPVLFTGTMRKNLDPFDEHADEELWAVLEEVQLKEAVEELPGKIETQLSESGSNFSVGQRQLVCLARAILRRNRILIIDEATANVDPRTDELIQKTIREKFAECTVLTIAHRLNTIIDSDKIMVLDSGRVKEYDEPYVLLQNKESLLYKMVQQVGKAEATALNEAAKQVYLKKINQENTKNRIRDNTEPFIIFETAL